MIQSLASDNCAGVLPEIMESVQRVNHDYVLSYGSDAHTKQAEILFQEVFQAPVEVRFCFNGTGANVLSLAMLTDVYNAILCADIAHIYLHEAMALETFTHCRLISVATDEQGKMTPDTIERQILLASSTNQPIPKALSLSQVTEYGTLYTINELEAIHQILKKHGLRFHMDGARLFNAAAHLNCSLHDITTAVGVDVLSLGGTKSGLLFGEAVILFNPTLDKSFSFLHKRSTQLASKNRFIAAQFSTLLQDQLWRKVASHSNNMATLLYQHIKDIPGILITKEVSSNAVFATIPEHWIKSLQADYSFHIWNTDSNEVRWMCSFATKEEDVMHLICALERLAKMDQLIA